MAELFAEENLLKGKLYYDDWSAHFNGAVKDSLKYFCNSTIYNKEKTGYIVLYLLHQKLNIMNEFAGNICSGAWWKIGRPYDYKYNNVLFTFVFCLDYPYKGYYKSIEILYNIFPDIIETYIKMILLGHNTRLRHPLLYTMNKYDYHFCTFLHKILRSITNRIEITKIVRVTLLRSPDTIYSIRKKECNDYKYDYLCKLAKYYEIYLYL